MVRRRAGRGAGLGRARSDTLALSPHQASTASAGVTASYSQDTEDILASERDLASLKARIWMIPKNFLELSGEVLGQGRWGSVVAGQVQTTTHLDIFIYISLSTYLDIYVYLYRCIQTGG